MAEDYLENLKEATIVNNLIDKYYNNIIEYELMDF